MKCILDKICFSFIFNRILAETNKLPEIIEFLYYCSTKYNICSRLQAGEEFTLWQNLLLGDAFPMYCVAIMASGVVGYILAIFQIFLVNE